MKCERHDGVPISTVTLESMEIISSGSRGRHFVVAAHFLKLGST